MSRVVLPGRVCVLYALEKKKCKPWGYIWRVSAFNSIETATGRHHRSNPKPPTRLYGEPSRSVLLYTWDDFLRYVMCLLNGRNNVAHTVYVCIWLARLYTTSVRHVVRVFTTRAQRLWNICPVPLCWCCTHIYIYSMMELHVLYV